MREGYCSCLVCVSVHGSNLLVAQLRDKLVILTDSVSWSLQNQFGFFRIMASFLRCYSVPILYEQGGVGQDHVCAIFADSAL